MYNLVKQRTHFLLLISLVWAIDVNAIPIQSTGLWTSLQQNNGVVSNVNGIGTNILTWGTPANPTSNPSGYVFSGVSPGDAPLNNTLFAIGDFTHGNFSISLPSVTGATLSVLLDFTGTGVTQNFNFFFEHIETPNSSNPCAEGGVNPCPDKVGIPDASSSETVNIGGLTYLLNIAGFSQDGGSSITSEFLTLEGQLNTATLFARLVPTQNSAPEPSIAGLLAIGMIGLWGTNAYRRRQNK